MARKNPLPAVEIGICKRVREFRESTNLSRIAFARRNGIDSSELVRVEHCRVPLRLRLARSICWNFKISPRWLATGAGDVSEAFIIPNAETFGVSDRAPFSAVYEHGIKQLLDRFTLPELQPLPPDFKRWGDFGSGIEGRLNAEGLIGRMVKDWLEIIPEIKLYPLIEAVLDAGSKAVHGCPRDGAEVDARRHEMRRQRVLRIAQQGSSGGTINQKRAEEPGLTDVSVSVKYRDVKAKLPSLLDRLKKATTKRGMKSKLAAWLKVPLASVSQWLSGEREPGGETTLRLLEWVVVAEAQQKTPGSGINTARGKATRRKDKTNESLKSGPPKSSAESLQKTSPV